MMRNLLTSLFVLVGFAVYGQLSYSPDPLVFTSDTSEVRAEYTFTIKNERTASQEFWWNIDRGNSPDEWTYAVCDINQCYLDGVESCPCSISCVLAGGESYDFKIYLIANGAIAAADINFNISTDCEGNTVILDVPMLMESTGLTSSIDIDSDLSELRVYPNPSTQYFQITNDADVNKIVVSNIIGKKVIEASHKKGESHDVSYLDKGIYLVRMIDKNSNILDVKRITIE